jgi:hypothetical protein
MLGASGIKALRGKHGCTIDEVGGPDWWAEEGKPMLVNATWRAKVVRR